MAYLPAKSLLAKVVLMTAQRDLCLGNSPMRAYKKASPRDWVDIIGKYRSRMADL
jgi:hypothetical protein